MGQVQADKSGEALVRTPRYQHASSINYLRELRDFLDQANPETQKKLLLNNSALLMRSLIELLDRVQNVEQGIEATLLRLLSDKELEAEMNRRGFRKVEKASSH